METTLQHHPTGWGNPYEQDRDERNPRQPMVGDPIVINAISKPAGKLHSVKLYWKCVKDSTWQKVDAELSDSRDNNDYWQAIIAPFEDSQKLIYYLDAVGDGVQLQSKVYSCSVNVWKKAEEVLSVKAHKNQLSIVHKITGSNKHYLCEIEKQTNNCLKITRRPFAAGDIEKRPEEQDDLESIWQMKDDDDNYSSWESERFHIIVYTKGARLSIEKDGKIIFQELEALRLHIDPDEKVHKYCQTLMSPEDEKFVGFGERFNALDQRGQVLDVQVFNQYKDQGKKTYIPIPCFLSSRGYTLYVDTKGYVNYDLAASRKNTVCITNETNAEGRLSFYLIAEKSWLKNVRCFAGLLPSLKLPPVWAFGLWMSSNAWDSQAKVRQQVTLTKNHKLPASVLVIEAWSDEQNFYIWNDAEYIPQASEKIVKLADYHFPSGGKWPDPKAMTDALHKEGLHLVLWQIPVLKHLSEEDYERYGLSPQHDIDEAYMIDQRYCVMNTDGSSYRIPPMKWFSESLVLDFTNAPAVEWWMNKRRYLLEEIGVDGFKTDGGEHILGREVRYSDGRDNAELCNAYPLLYQAAFRDFILQCGNKDGVLFSRSGFTGAGQSPCHWAGDQESTWDSFRAVILAGMNLGVSGVPFWGWDIGGFAGPLPDAELYLRSTAAAAFAPIMQYHSDYMPEYDVKGDRTPWNIQRSSQDERVIPIFQKFVWLRMNLLPYIYSQAAQAVNDGLPLMRMPYVVFEDPVCLDYPYQFMLGDSLLVAPVVEEGRTDWEVYLPGGEWIDFWTGQKMSGGCVINVDADLDSIPVFVRVGALLMMNLGDSLVLPSYVGNDLGAYHDLCFVLYPVTGKREYNWLDYVSGRLNKICVNMDSKEERITIDMPEPAYQLRIKVFSERVRKFFVNGRPTSFERADGVIWLTLDN